MGKSCCVHGCRNRFSKGSGISFHRFPVDEALKALWIQALRRGSDWHPTQYTWICGHHFQLGRPSHNSHHPDHVPNVRLSQSVREGGKQCSSSSSSAARKGKNALRPQHALDFSATGPNHGLAEQHSVLGQQCAPAEERIQESGEQCARAEELLPREPLASEMVLMNEDLGAAITEGAEQLRTQLREGEQEKLRMASQLAVQLGAREQHSQKLQAQLRACQLEVQLLQAEKSVLQQLRIKEAARKAPSSNELLADSFLDDPQRCCYYTALPSSEMVSWVFSLVLPGIDCKSKIAPIKQLLLVLIKIKLDLQLKDLAYRFNTSTSTVTRIIDSWLPEMGKKLAGLIKWPNQNEINNSLPQCFELSKYKNTVVIIDLLEITTQKWGSKNETVLKVLVGFAPNGSITYLSQCLECDASDGLEFQFGEDLLSCLKEGDVVLADRRFDASQIALTGAELVCPPFVDGKQRVSHQEILEGRKILDVRAHVKKVINRMKMFRILAAGVMPHTHVKHANFIVHTCAGLLNLNPPFTR